MKTLDEQDLSSETLGSPAAGSLGHALDCVYRKLAPTGAGDLSASISGTLFTSESGAALARLVSIFSLTDFELDLLVLCVGATLESRFRNVCAAHHPEGWPTLRLALSAFENSHWSAISRARPLRYWRLIEAGSEPLLDAAVRIDERILHFLLGIPTVDERLEALIRPLDWNASPDDSDAFPDATLTDTAPAVATRWRQANPGPEPVLLIATFDSVRKSAFQTICRQAQRH